MVLVDGVELGAEGVEEDGAGAGVDEEESLVVEEAAGLSADFWESDLESEGESPELEEESPGPEEASLEPELLGA